MLFFFTVKPVFGGHPVLSGQYSIPRGCSLNTGFTVLVSCSGSLFKCNHRRTGNFLPGGAVVHLPKKFLQVAQIFTKQSKGN